MDYKWGVPTTYSLELALQVLGCPRKLANGLFHLLINGIYWGYNPLTTLPETSIAPENGWLEYDPFLFGFRPIFRGEKR